MSELNVIQDAPLTMSSREIAELTGSRHDSVKRTVDTLAAKGVIVHPQSVDEQENDAMGRPRATKVYRLAKRDSLIVVAQLCPEFTARIVDRWQELEAKAQSNAIMLPDFTNPALAARAWADQVEARMRAEATKAEIGSRREAIAMNTASQAVKKLAKLEIKLDESMRYATVKRMAKTYLGRNFDWRLLKSVSSAMDIPPIDVFDANYGSVKAYHANAWRTAYGLEIKTGERGAAA